MNQGQPDTANIVCAVLLFLVGMTLLSLVFKPSQNTRAHSPPVVPHPAAR